MKQNIRNIYSHIEVGKDADEEEMKTDVCPCAFVRPNARLTSANESIETRLASGHRRSGQRLGPESASSPKQCSEWPENDRIVVLPDGRQYELIETITAKIFTRRQIISPLGGHNGWLRPQNGAISPDMLNTPPQGLRKPVCAAG